MDFNNYLGQRIVLDKRWVKVVLHTLGVPHLGTRIRSRLLAKLAKENIPTLGNMIDAGCGYGFNSLSLSKIGFRVTAVDNDSIRLNIAQFISEKKEIQFLKANLYNLPFKNGFFAGGICFEVLEHLRDDERALQELSRVIKKDGYLVLSFPELESGKYHLEKLNHVRSGYSIEQMSQMTKALGWKKVRVESFGKSFLGRLVFFADFKLLQISPLGSVLAFPFFYPLILLDQLLLSSGKPTGYVMLLKHGLNTADL